jgi:D-glycero-D-manno-heptose 1,7-bisphosphate phosphatase
MADDTSVPMLFLDIDGTVRQGKEDALGRFVNGPQDVVVFPAAVTRMRAWKAGGGRVIGVSNQGGIALGLVSMSQVVAAMMETQRQCHGLFDKIVFCQHHPDAEHPEMARCWCRKPRPGLAIEGAIELARRYSEIYPPYMALFVGDRDEDSACASALNVDFMWAADWRDGGTDG